MDLSSAHDKNEFLTTNSQPSQNKATEVCTQDEAFYKYSSHYSEIMCLSIKKEDSNYRQLVQANPHLQLIWPRLPPTIPICMMEKSPGPTMLRE